jgi:hypothetical protein
MRINYLIIVTTPYKMNKRSRSLNDSERDGDHLIKSCKYLPKEKVAAIQDLQTQKASIVEILRVLS